MEGATMKILTAVQMAEVDRLTTERYLIPSILLMENAGRSFADEVEKACPGLENKNVVVLCGRGNNGGDGFVAARYLSLRNVKPSILFFSDPAKLRGDALTNFEIAHAMGLPIRTFSTLAEAKSHLRKTPPPDVVVDALFGTGLSKPIGPDFRPMIDWINKAYTSAFIASVDIPSGLFADSPSIPGPAVKAHLTVTFSALKLAQVAPPASDFAGKVVLMPIGSPQALLENPEYRLNLIDPSQVRRALPRRAPDSHKGSFGHVYVVAGSGGKSGAALMTGFAALRSGAGLVTLWLPKSLQRGVVGKFPELMTEFLPETEEETSDKAGANRVLERLAEMEALVVGPGMTMHPSTRKLIWELVRRSPVPVVLDADGINAFAAPAAPLQNEMGQPVIITPHPGEMARLLGKKIAEVQKNRLETARSCAALNRCYVVLKGFQTVIASPAGDLFINSTGNPGMATGGTGDILAGMMGRFVAGWKHQSGRENAISLVDYISAAVYLHGLAGDLAADEEGMESLIATDLLTFLPKAFKKVANP
jgi:ADP-dependent NAD(P)H-hydrate dehydratase / NAD(P)H-hydrate epimerase